MICEASICGLNKCSIVGSDLECVYVGGVRAITRRGSFDDNSRASYFKASNHTMGDAWSI